MPYMPTVGTTENNNGPTPTVGTTAATVPGPTVMDPSQSTTVQDGQRTLKDATALVVVGIVLLWGAVLGLKL